MSRNCDILDETSSKQDRKSKRVLKQNPEAIRLRQYRERLQADGIGEADELRKKARERMRTNRELKKTPEAIQAKEDRRVAKADARKLSEALRKRKARENSCKPVTASTKDSLC